MEVQYSQEQLFYQQLKTEKFKQPKFNQDPQNHKNLIEFLKNLEVPKSQEQTKMLVGIIFNLVKFYGVSIAICLNSFYKKIGKQSDLVKLCSQQFKDIATIIKTKLKNRVLTQLSFIFNLCGKSNKKIPISQSKQQEQFINYIEHLGKLLGQLQTIVKKGSKIIGQNQFGLNVQKSIGQILEANMERKANILQANYENYFKSMAMNIINQIEQNLTSSEKPSQNLVDIDRGIQKQKKQLKIDPNTPLCCRTFFFKNETINQPQSLHLQYKNYKKFPWPNNLIDILKKAICGFLNAQGGILFIGIAESVQSKRRIVTGQYYDQGIKQDVLRCFRRIGDSIEPNIITHKLYKVQFVPIRNNIQPYNYISGKYVIKVTIRYGIRDDIYSYNSQGSQQDLFAFRTQNEVILRKGRLVLNALKQRIKNPLPIPEPLHQGFCPKPQTGKPIYQGQKFDASFENTVMLPKSIPYTSTKKSPQKIKNQNQNNRKNQFGPQKGNKFNQCLQNIPSVTSNSFHKNSNTNSLSSLNHQSKNPKVYRSKYVHYLIQGATVDKLKQFWNSHKFSTKDLSATLIQTDLILVLLTDINIIQNFIKLFQQMKNQLSVTIVYPSLILKFPVDLDTLMVQTIYDSMNARKMNFSKGNNDKQLYFNDMKDAVKAYHLIKLLFGVNAQFQCK